MKPIRHTSTFGDRLADRRVRYPGLDVEEKLMIQRSTDPQTGCWRWPGCHNRKGYALLSVRGRCFLVHRLAHTLWVGPIPHGYTVDHVYERGCRYRDCYNPAHLEAVPHVENVGRSPHTLTSIAAAKTHCPKGHAYDEENTYVWRGKRICRMCRREYRLIWNRRQR